MSVSVAAMERSISEDMKILKICARFDPGVFSDERRERDLGNNRNLFELINANPRLLEF